MIQSTNKNKNGRLAGVWTQDQKDPDTKRKIDEAVKLMLEGPVGKRLKQLIEKRKLEIAASELRTDQYDYASWPFLQAHRNGQVAELGWIEDILNIRYET